MEKGDKLERQDSVEKKKKALDFLDQQIQSLNKKNEKVVNVTEAKFKKMEQEALDGFMNDMAMGSESSDSPNKQMTFGKSSGNKRLEPNWG